MGNGKWEMENREMGNVMGNGKWEMGNKKLGNGK